MRKIVVWQRDFLTIPVFNILRHYSAHKHRQILFEIWVDGAFLALILKWKVLKPNYLAENHPVSYLYVATANYYSDETIEFKDNQFWMKYSISETLFVNVNDIEIFRVVFFRIGFILFSFKIPKKCHWNFLLENWLQNLFIINESCKNSSFDLNFPLLIIIFEF